MAYWKICMKCFNWELTEKRKTKNLTDKQGRQNGYSNNNKYYQGNLIA